LNGLSLSAAFPRARVDSASGSANVFLVAGDQLANFSSLVRGVGSGIGHRAAQPDVITHVVHAIRFNEKILDVGLPDAESSISVASVMRFASFGHLSCSLE